MGRAEDDFAIEQAILTLEAAWSCDGMSRPGDALEGIHNNLLLTLAAVLVAKVLPDLPPGEYAQKVLETAAKMGRQPR